MKQQYLFSLKASIIIYSVFGIIILSAFIFFGSRYRQSQKEIAQLIKQKVNGKILSVDDLGRGSISLILLTDSNTRYITTGLPIAWEIEKFEIRKGDSLHKNYNSNKIFFFRKTPNGYVQVGNAEIWR